MVTVGGRAAGNLHCWLTTSVSLVLLSSGSALLTFEVRRKLESNRYSFRAVTMPCGVIRGTGGLRGPSVLPANDERP